MSAVNYCQVVKSCVQLIKYHYLSDKGNVLDGKDFSKVFIGPIFPKHTECNHLEVIVNIYAMCEKSSGVRRPNYDLYDVPLERWTFSADLKKKDLTADLGIIEEVKKKLLELPLNDYVNNKKDSKGIQLRCEVKIFKDKEEIPKERVIPFCSKPEIVIKVDGVLSVSVVYCNRSLSQLEDFRGIVPPEPLELSGTSAAAPNPVKPAHSRVSNHSMVDESLLAEYPPAEGTPADKKPEDVFAIRPVNVEIPSKES